MSFSYGSFAGGLAQGAEAGVGMADKLRQLNDAARVRAARGALGRAYASDIPLTDGSAPLPPPVTPPSPGVASVPSAAAAGPAPQQDMSDPAQYGTPANDVSGMGNGAPAPPSPLPPPMPQVSAASNVPPTGAGPATGTDGTPLSGTAASTTQPSADPQVQLTSTITDANNTIKAIAAAVRQANPNIDPETLFEATSQHINQMKGVRNEVKDYMQTQVEYAKIQQRMQGVIARVAGQKDVADTRAGATTGAAQIAADSRRDVGAGHDQARVTSVQLSSDARTAAAQIAAQGGITRAQIAADTNRYVADANNKTRVYDTQLQQYVKIATSNDSDQAKVDAAGASAGQKPPARQRLNPLPMPAAPGGAGGPPPVAAGQPPQAVLNKIPEGKQMPFTSGSGVTQVWQKLNGVISRVK